MKRVKIVRKKSCLLLLLTLPLLLLCFSCAPSTENPANELAHRPVTVTVLHTGDTHSYVIPHDVMFKFGDTNALMAIGGWSLMKEAIDEVRNREQNVLLLHSGDTVEGTIWSDRFSGLADFEAMNTLKFDAVVLGNHEFSRGPQGAANLINIVKFPVLAANLDVSLEPALAGRVKPYITVDFEGEKIGIIGLITPDTEITAYPGRTIKFLPVEETARKYIAELENQGINKIAILSHLGYGSDVNLAGSVDGIDIIVGGHTHMLMEGPEFKQIGLNPAAPYPVEVKAPNGDSVLIVHAWENNQMLGQIKLDFDEKGKISSYNGSPVIPATNNIKAKDHYGWGHLCSCQPLFGTIMAEVAKYPVIRIYWTNTDMDRVLQPYIAQISNELNAVVAVAGSDLIRGLNQGPGPIVADSFLWTARKLNPETQVALIDSYHIRSDVYHGTILANDLYMVLPFQHNLVTARMPGSAIKMMLEYGIDMHIKVGDPPPCYDISGLKMTIDMSRSSGDRITALQVMNADNQYEDMNMDTEYTLVTTDYLADKSLAAACQSAGWLKPFMGIIKTWARGAAHYQDLGVKDIDALTDYLRLQQNVKDSGEQRIIILKPAAK